MPLVPRLEQREQLRYLRQHRWSDYRAYVELCKNPAWLSLYVMATHSRSRQTGREIREAMGGITTSAVTRAKERVERKQKPHRAFRRRIAAIFKSIVSP